MKILLQISDSIYSCAIQITDTFGTKCHLISLEEAEPDRPYEAEIDVGSPDFTLTVIPDIADHKAALADMEIQNWKDKLAKKVGNALLSALDHSLLRVGCTYMIADAKENDVIHICGREYVFGTFDRFDLLNLIPMAYTFFEAFHNGILCRCSAVFPTNRKEVIAHAKKLALCNFGLQLIFSYPFQVGRIKRLTSNRKVRKTLSKFNRLSEQKRQKILTKQEKFLSR
jgi:hypothetical protein